MVQPDGPGGAGGAGGPGNAGRPEGAGGPRGGDGPDGPLKGPIVAGSLAMVLLFAGSLFDPLAGAVPAGTALHRAAGLLSFIGNGGFLIPLTLILLITGWFLKKEDIRLAGRDSLYAVLLSGAAVQVLKAVFERPRPAHVAGHVLYSLAHPSFFDLTGKFNSFPSGHTATAFAVASVLGARFRRLRAPLYVLASLIALSRIALGSHYPSDIAGGMILGLTTGWLLQGRGTGGGGRKKWLMAGLVFLVISISFFKTGGYLLFDVDEAVFSEASREMVVTGDVITPTYNFEPRYDKPILFYWAMAGAFKVMGATEFAARFTSAGLGVLLVLVTFLFARRFCGQREALWSALVLLLNLEFFVYSHSAVTDMTLCFFIASALYAAFGAVKTGDRRLYLAFWVSSALAMLTKGAIGLLFPLSITLVYLFVQKDMRAVRRLLNPLYILAFLAVAMPWFLLEYHAQGYEWFDAFIIKHHIHRFTGVISSHGGPPYFYVLVLLAGFFPWVALLPEALIRGVRNIRQRFEKHDVFLFSTIWFFFVFIFFSISRTKLPNYIFPAIPACSVMVGAILAERMRGGRGKMGGPLFMALLSLVLSVAAFITPRLGVKMDIPLPASLFTGLGVIFLLAALFSVLLIYNPRRYAPLLAAAVAALLVFLRLEAIPPVNAFMQQDLHEYAVYAKRAGERAVLATYEINQPSIVFYYADGKVLKLEGKAPSDLRLKKGKDLLVITKKERIRELEGDAGFRTIREGREFALLERDKG